MELRGEGRWRQGKPTFQYKGPWVVAIDSGSFRSPTLSTAQNLTPLASIDQVVLGKSGIRSVLTEASSTDRTTRDETLGGVTCSAMFEARSRNRVSSFGTTCSKACETRQSLLSCKYLFVSDEIRGTHAFGGFDKQGEIFRQVDLTRLEKVRKAFESDFDSRFFQVRLRV